MHACIHTYIQGLKPKLIAYVHMRVCVYIYIHIWHTYIYMHACMHISGSEAEIDRLHAYVCVCVCVCVCTHACIYIHTHSRVWSQNQSPTRWVFALEGPDYYTYMQMHMHTYIYTHAYQGLKPKSIAYALSVRAWGTRLVKSKRCHTHRICAQKVWKLRFVYVYVCVCVYVSHAASLYQYPLQVYLSPPTCVSVPQ